MTKARDFAMMVGRSEAINPTRVALLDGDAISVADSAAVSSIVGNVGTTVYDSLGALPVAGLTAGQQAFVSANNRLYISNGNGWYNVASVNATPILATNAAAGTIALTPGTPLVVTLTATDSDNADANLAITLESGGDLFKFATISQDSSVVTITPRTADSATSLGSDGSATLTFKASDGIGVASVVNTFTLSFGPDWSGSYTDQVLIADDVANDQFGASVGMSGDGDWAFITDRNGGGGTGQGQLFAYKKTGTTWAQHTAFGTANGSNQTVYGAGNNGADLNSDGTFGVFGLPAYNSNKGALRVYKRTGDTYGNAQTYTQTADNGAQLGASVAMSNDGNYMIAGAPDAAGGKVHFFNLSNSSNNTWSTNGVFSRTTTDHSTLGDEVCIDATGTYAVAGAPSDGSSYPGYAYIYKRTSSTWALETTLTNPDSEANARFGVGLAINHDGDVLYVGAYALNGTGGVNEAGKVHMYTRSGTTWTLRASFLSAATSTTEEAFGRSLDCSSDGNTLYVSCPYIAGGAGGDGYGGAVEVWTRDGNTMTNAKIINNSNIQSGGVQAGSAAAYDLWGYPLATSNSGNEFMAASAYGRKTSASNASGIVVAVRPT